MSSLSSHEVFEILEPRDNFEQSNDPDPDSVGPNSGDTGAGDAVLVSEFVRTHRNPVEVSRKNKIICTAAYLVFILAIMLYFSGLAYFQRRFVSISAIPHFSEPITANYVIMGIDVVASVLGIWTCLAKTGPKPMIFACVWLLITTLANVCVTVALTFEGKSYIDLKTNTCRTSPNSEDCLAFGRLTIYLWCSLTLGILKSVVITLCRLNYPQVFNWMVGKQVYVDDELVPVDLFQVPNLGGAYFDQCDLERLTARGSLGGKITEIGNDRVIIVTKEDLKEAEVERVDGNVGGRTRREERGSLASVPSITFKRSGRII